MLGMFKGALHTAVDARELSIKNRKLTAIEALLTKWDDRSKLRSEHVKEIMNTHKSAMAGQQLKSTLKTVLKMVLAVEKLENDWQIIEKMEDAGVNDSDDPSRKLNK